MHLSANSVAADVALDSPARAVVITGLEDAPRPVMVRLRSELAAAERARTVPLIIWVRDEERDDAPAWLVRLANLTL